MRKAANLARSLYIHLPFCHRLCAYCDFPKVLYSRKWGFSYMEALLKELEGRNIAPGSLETVYLGGGTPSALPLDLLSPLLKCLKPLLSPYYEWTVEMNPEDASDALYAALREAGVTRLSFGLQSASPRLLGYLGRRHTSQEALEAVERAKKHGFLDLSADMIYAIPGEGVEELEGDVEAFLSLDVGHLSAYSLEICPGTSLYVKGAKEPGDAFQAAQYEAILKAFRAAGYERYEVSSFARPGHRARHNLAYWREEDYIAVGLGAAGLENGVRYKNTRNFGRYLKGECRAREDLLSEKDRLEEYFLTNLRLAEGFSLKEFAGRFGFPFLPRYEKEAHELIGQGLLNVSDGRVFASDRGILLLDRILLTLF